MTLKIVLSLILLSGLGHFTAQEPIVSEKKALKEISKALNEKDLTITGQINVLDNSNRKEPITIYSVVSQGNKNPIYAAFTRAKGRHDYFDYLLVTTNDYKVERVKIVQYRSEYGGQIASKRWLRQFENYSGGNLRYKKEITALSGATISAAALTSDIPEVLKFMKESSSVTK